MSKSTTNSAISALWKIIVIFTFVYLILYTFEPGFVKDDAEEVSKSKIFMGSILTAVVITGILWAVSSSTSDSKVTVYESESKVDTESPPSSTGSISSTSYKKSKKSKSLIN